MQRHVDKQVQQLLEAVRSLEGAIQRKGAPATAPQASGSLSSESIGCTSLVRQQVSTGGRRADGVHGRAGSRQLLEVTRPSPRLLGSTGRSVSACSEQDDGLAQVGSKAQPLQPIGCSTESNGEQQEWRRHEAPKRTATRPTYMSRRSRCSASVLGIDDAVNITESEKEAEKEKERNAKLGLTHALGMGKSISRRRSFEEITNKVNDNYHDTKTNCSQKLVESTRFELLSGAVIIANVVAMGIQANERIRDPHPSCDLVWHLVNLGFNVFFVIELALRLGAFGRRFLKGKDKGWNCFDMVIVGCGVIEEIVQWSIVLKGKCDASGEFGAGIDAVRVIRVLRLMRLGRVIRVMHHFSELRIMVRSVLVCLAPLCWACILLLLIQWCFGVFFCTLAADHISSNLNGKSPAEQDSWLQEGEVATLSKYWGSLWMALYTLFLSVTNGLDWQAAADSLSIIGWHPYIFYILYIALTSFAVLNVVTGVFVENAMKIALRDRDLQVQVQLEQRKKIMERLLSVFNEADYDRDGTISWDDFEAHIGDPKVQAFFSHLELGGADAGRLFRLLDRNGNGKVDAEEFVTGCLILRGGAKTMDVAAVMLEQQIFMEYFAEQLDYLREAVVQGGPTQWGAPLTTEPSPTSRHRSTASRPSTTNGWRDSCDDIMV
jgi:voltage-gated sodium channel